MSAEKVTIRRCDSCGAQVEDPIDWESQPDGTKQHVKCPRAPGQIVRLLDQNLCAIKDCALARRGTVLKSAAHFADHMHWHHQQWEAEEAAMVASPAPAPAPAALAAPAPAYDYWCHEAYELAPGATVQVELMPPPSQPRARCVALVAYGWNVAGFTVQCEQLGGAAPLGAYPLSLDDSARAVVPMPPTEGPIRIWLRRLEGTVVERVQLAARWEYSSA